MAENFADYSIEMSREMVDRLMHEALDQNRWFAGEPYYTAQHTELKLFAGHMGRLLGENPSTQVFEYPLHRAVILWKIARFNAGYGKFNQELFHELEEKLLNSGHPAFSRRDD